MSDARTLWEEGHELGHQVVSLAFALTLTVASLDLTLGGEVGHVFDAAFVVVSVLVALLVRPQDFFMIGVLPPLVMLVVFALVALARRAPSARRARAPSGSSSTGSLTTPAPWPWATPCAWRCWASATSSCAARPRSATRRRRRTGRPRGRPRTSR